MNISKIIYFALSLFLGVFMLLGGYDKFSKPYPKPTQMIEQIEKEGSAKLKANEEKLRIKNYIFGMKQTGYFWQFLGICELLLGALVLSQYLRFPAAVMLVPITLQIFLFHLFLEFDETSELLETGALLAANLALVFKEFNTWKSLLVIKP